MGEYCNSDTRGVSREGVKMERHLQYTYSDILKKTNNILILSPLEIHNVLNGHSGGEKLVKEQLKYFKEINKNVKLESLVNISYAFKLFKIFQNSARINKRFARDIIKRKKTSPFGSFLAPIVMMLIELLLLFDPRVKKACNNIKEEYDLIILNFPFGAATLKKLTNKPMIVLEHNVEYRFLEEKFRTFGMSNKIVSALVRILVRVYKKIEIHNLRHADFVFCVSPRDKSVLLQDFKQKGNICVWLPIRTKEKSSTPSLPYKKEKILIGFVGSSASHNIDAVEKIIELSKKLPSTKFEFWIIGSVGDVFRGQENKLPSNIKFLGFVENLSSILEKCDIFINPKFISATGVEVKMFDYLRFNKPIISTSLGAEGFEELIGKKIFISDSIEEMAELLSSIIGGGG